MSNKRTPSPPPRPPAPPPLADSLVKDNIGIAFPGTRYSLQPREAIADTGLP